MKKVYLLLVVLIVVLVALAGVAFAAGPVENVQQFLTSWWGLAALLVVLAFKLATDFQGTKQLIRVLIWQAEEQARHCVINGGQEKMAWVVANGYGYLPAWLRLILSEAAFKALVQSVFNSMEQWANEQGLTDRTGP